MTVQFGHGARDLKGTGLEQAEPIPCSTKRSMWELTMCPNEANSTQDLIHGLSLLGRLLERRFQGAAELRQQMNLINAEVIDENGSLGLHPTVEVFADVARRIPVEASYDDIDGITVHVLVHVIAGLLNELEIYREDLALVMLPAANAPDLRIEDWT